MICPMLEAWLWMESDHVANAFGWKDYGELKARLVQEGLWNKLNPNPTIDEKGSQASIEAWRENEKWSQNFASVFRRSVPAR